ncbi:hypothetical protein [Pontimicrobium sp. MEBiC01747]
MLSTILLIIVLILFALYIYKYPPKSSTVSNTKICMDYSNVNMNQLEVDLVRNMISGYKDYQKRYIDNASNLDDAHSIWFDLETLKTFIYHTEYNTLQNSNVVSKPELGLRIHYSRYPKFENWKNFSDLNDLATDPLGKQYGEHHTLVIIPTIKRKDGKHVNFNPLDTNTYTNGMPFDYPGTPSTTTVPSFGITKKGNNSGGSTGSQNHGSLIPPADGSGGF